MLHRALALSRLDKRNSSPGSSRRASDYAKWQLAAAHFCLARNSDFDFEVIVDACTRCCNLLPPMLVNLMPTRERSLKAAPSASPA